MRHDGLDKKHLFLEIHAGDKAVLVTADVEDERPGSGSVIGRRERLRYFRKMLPSGGPGDGEETGKRLTRCGVLLCKSFGRRFAVNRHLQQCSHSWEQLSSFFEFLTMRLRLQERPLLQLLKRLLELFLRVHHDWTVPGHRLLQRLPRDQEKSDPVLSGLYLQLISPVEEHKRAIVSLRRRRRVQPADTLRRHSQRTGRVTKLPRACEDVRKSVTSCFHRQGIPPSP